MGSVKIIFILATAIFILKLFSLIPKMTTMERKITRLENMYVEENDPIEKNNLAVKIWKTNPDWQPKELTT